MSRFEEILSGCRRQRPQSMLELYNICAEPVYSACLHIVANESDAEEIMQDAILKAFDNIDRFMGSQKDFIAFAKKIGVNKSIDWYRKHKKEPFFTEVDNQAEEIVDEDVTETIPIEVIKEKINELPDGYRMVISLHLLDELDFIDIANIMKINASSVRSQYVRAKDKLRKLLTTN